jgi:hypothetical protein
MTAKSRTNASAKRSLAGALAVAAVLAVAGPARADDYDPGRAGHPLRLIAYALHPVGVAIDYLLMRPAHWLVEKEPARTIFGHTGDTHRVR